MVTKTAAIRKCVVFLLLDVIVSGICPFLPPLQPFISSDDLSFSNYSMNESVVDFPVLLVLRLLAISLTVIVSLLSTHTSVSILHNLPQETHTRSGVKKTKEALEEEILEEPWKSYISRTIHRPMLYTEIVCILQILFISCKCFDRIFAKDVTTSVWIFWGGVMSCSLCCTAYTSLISDVCVEAIKSRDNLRERRKRRRGSESPYSRFNGESLEDPLLSQSTTSPRASTESSIALPEITADTAYKAGWFDLFKVCRPDAYYIFMAFVFLVLAAIAQVRRELELEAT